MRTRAMAAAVTISALVLVAFAGLVATNASHSDTTDPNDTPGRLDVREIRLDHYPTLEWTFRTAGGWRLPDVWDRGFFVIELDTRDDKEIDARIVARSDGRTLEAQLIAIRDDGTERVRETFAASKDALRTASVEVPWRWLALGRDRIGFAWYAYSVFVGSDCQRVCVDRVPDDGRIEQLLPGTSPSPSPTPTPTPEPTVPPGPPS